MIGFACFQKNGVLRFLTNKFKIMAFNGTEGGSIDIDDAGTLTENYRNANPSAVKGAFYGKDILRQLLDQEGCMGIRIYYGEDKNGNKELVLVGAQANEDDMLELVADNGTKCPSNCGVANSLNS